MTAIEKKTTVAEETTVEKKNTKKNNKKPMVPKGVVVNCSNLCLRATPFATGKQIELIPGGSVVTINHERSTRLFYYVTTPTGKEGFCKKDYIHES